MGWRVSQVLKQLLYCIKESENSKVEILKWLCFVHFSWPTPNHILKEDVQGILFKKKIFFKFYSLIWSAMHLLILRQIFKERLGGSVSWAADFSSGHDLAVCEFEPRVWLCADSSEPGACFRLCVSFSLWPSPIHALSLSVPKINLKKKKDRYSRTNCKKVRLWSVFSFHS